MDSHPDQAPNTHPHKPADTSDLLASAKEIFQQGTGNFDKAKAADAAADLLSSASHYGKLEETGVGKYVEKAEDYLHKFGSSHGSTHSATDEAVSHPATHTEAGSGDHEKMKMAETADAHSEGGFSDLTKKVGDSEGGIGGYMKMAEGFFK